MPHLPVNHPLRPAYRAAATLTGGYLLLFGIIGVARTGGSALFAQTGLTWALGLRTNRALAIASIAAGIVLILAAAVGRNLDVRVNLVAGTVFLAVGTLMLTLIRTSANVLGFSLVNCIASYVIGTLLLAAGLYGKTATST